MAATTMLFQTPFQDIPTQLPPTYPNEDGRTSSTIYMDRLQWSGTLVDNPATPISPAVPVRFRVVVVRYIGEMDFNVDNNIATGWDALSNQGNHMVFPGEDWLTKPYVKGQIQVLYDREFTLQELTSDGVVVSFNIPIKKKLIFESVLGGASAVGVGNTFIGISSNGSRWNLYDSYTTASYKEI